MNGSSRNGAVLCGMAGTIYSLLSIDNIKVLSGVESGKPTRAFIDLVSGFGKNSLSAATAFLVAPSVNQESNVGKARTSANNTSGSKSSVQYMSTYDRYRIERGIV